MNNNNKNNIIEFKLVGGGSIIVERNPEIDYDGATVLYKTEQGHIIDLVCIECKSENNYNKIDVYTYEDETSDDFTRKFTLDKNKIDKSFE